MSAQGATDRPTDRVEPRPALTCEGRKSATTTVEPTSSARTSVSTRLTLRDRLSERDLAVLDSLAQLRLLTGAQVQRLHVADGSVRTRARRARALLQRLVELKLIVRLGRRVGGVRAGSAGFVYGLSGHGQAVLGLCGLHGGQRRRVWETSPGFQDHVLNVAELYVGLVESDRCGEVELLGFDAEPACWRRATGNAGQAVILKPDGYLRLGIGEVERSAFIEVDLATESTPTIARKCCAYIAYWRSGVEQAAHGVFPVVVWLTITEHRAVQIAAVVKRLPVEARHLFEVALLANAIPTLTTTAPGGRMA